MATWCPERPPVHYHPSLRYRCAWCGTTMSPGPIGALVLDGICPSCAARIRAPRLHALMDEVERRQLVELEAALRNLAARKVELSEVTAAYYRRRFLS